MTRRLQYSHEFVEFIPEKLEDGFIYLTLKYTTASHLCFCGCGHKVVTPITPHDWSLIFDGDTVSLHPSVGNWGLPCRSHYWMRQGKLIWAPQWSQREIDAAKKADSTITEQYFRNRHGQPTHVPAPSVAPSLLDRMKRFIGWK